MAVVDNAAGAANFVKKAERIYAKANKSASLFSRPIPLFDGSIEAYFNLLIFNLKPRHWLSRISARSFMLKQWFSALGYGSLQLFCIPWHADG